MPRRLGMAGSGLDPIGEGTAKLGGGMPAWKGKFSEDDIEAVIAWFQSRWPEEVYQSWAFMDEKACRGADAALRLRGRPGGRSRNQAVPGLRPSPRSDRRRFSLPSRSRRLKIPASLTFA